MYKLKSSQQVYSIQEFQNGSLALLEIPSRKRRFSLQDRSGRCLFPSATVHELKKVCEICLVGKSLRICLPVFWVRTCSQDIFKTIKGTNSSTETAEHLVIYLHDILLMGRTEEISMSRDTLIFLVQHLGFAINLKQSVLKPSQQRYFLDLKIDTHTMSLALTEKKIEKVILKCQNLLSHPQTNVLELAKLIGLINSTVQAVLPARLQLRY